MQKLRFIDWFSGKVNRMALRGDRDLSLDIFHHCQSMWSCCYVFHGLKLSQLCGCRYGIFQFWGQNWSSWLRSSFNTMLGDLLLLVAYGFECTIYPTHCSDSLAGDLTCFFCGALGGRLSTACRIVDTPLSCSFVYSSPGLEISLGWQRVSLFTLLCNFGFDFRVLLDFLSWAYMHVVNVNMYNAFKCTCIIHYWTLFVTYQSLRSILSVPV